MVLNGRWYGLCGMPLSPVLLHGTTFFIALHCAAAAIRVLLPRDDAARPGIAGPAWSGYSTVTFGSCVAGALVSTNQSNATWGPGAGN